MRLLILATLLATSTPSLAEIYMCEENGKKTFSQQPCGKNAQSVTVQKRQGTIVLPETVDMTSATNICEMMINSWEMASQMRRNRIDQYDAQNRVFGYVREHISNFEERSRVDSTLYERLQNASYKITAAAYTGATLNQPGERDAAIKSCADGIMANIGSGKISVGGSFRRKSL